MKRITSRAKKTVIILLCLIVFGLIVFFALHRQPFKATMEPRDFVWGINGHPMQSEIYTHPWPKGIDFNKQFELIKDLGTNWYRFGIKSWQANLPAGQNIFYYTDQFVNPALQNNINLVAILSPVVDFDGANNVYPGNSSEFEQLLSYNYEQNYSLGAQYGEHYQGKINYWQLGNEVFNKNWAPIQSKPSPTNKIKYPVSNSGNFRFYREPTQIIQASIKGLNDGIKAKNPAAKTILQSYWIDVPSFSRMVSSNEAKDNYCLDFVRNDFQSTDFHTEACQDNPKYDIINANIAGWFWYSDMDNNLGARFPGNDKNLLFNTIGSSGKDIWIVEGNIKNGNCSSSENQMSDYLASSAEFFKKQGKVKGYFVYELLDEPYYLYGKGSSCEEGNYGLVKVEYVDGKWQVKGLKSTYQTYWGIINPQTGFSPSPVSLKVTSPASSIPGTTSSSSADKLTPTPQNGKTATLTPSASTSLKPNVTATGLSSAQKLAKSISSGKKNWIFNIICSILIIAGIIYLWRKHRRTT